MTDTSQEIPLDLQTLAQIQLEDSKKWFPYLHDGDQANALIPFMTMGLAGEIGEFANIIKKLMRLEAKRKYIEEHYPQEVDTLADIAEEMFKLGEQAEAEHTDILCYWLNIGALMAHNLEAAWRANRRSNEARWG